MVFEKSLTAMVKGIRAHRGKETEYINVCLQEIQKEATSKNLATKSMAVLKLAYLNMLGYDMSWSTFAVTEVMSHNRFAIKRPGYLASSMCFTESTDVGLLTINLFKKDFGSKSQYESGMAISCLSSICTPEISRIVIGDLLSMLSSSRAYLRKKTVLCLYRVFLKDPPALRTCFPKLKERLGDEDQGVLTATVNTFLELARKNARNYLSLVPQLYHILVNTSNNWLAIKLLKLFQLLCPLEPRLPAKMVEPLMNLLNTTKAQSVEFEAIRCTVRTMPEGTALSALAIEKLQTFLNSSDRNLRFLGLELFREILEKPAFKDKITVPDLHAKVLQGIEESDTTARKIALQLLDQIVTPATFVDAVKKLLEFSKNACPPDEFVGTILRMGARDRYALVEDFAWYLLVLADIARNLNSSFAGQVAEQFTDIAARVPQVRPYAATLALGLLDRTPSPGVAGEEGSCPVDVAMPMVGACAWVIGEYHECFEGPAEETFPRAARALLAGRQIQSLEPSLQTQCIWAATKLYLGAPKHAPGAVGELHEVLTANLPSFVRSTHVDVSERAALSLQLATFFEGDAAKVAAGTPLFEEPLLPVHPGAQKSLTEPAGLGLDEPFFAVEETPQEAFVPIRADPTDPYALAATYKDDLGFLAARDARQQPAAMQPSAEPGTSMFYLQSREQGTPGSGGDKAAAEGAPAEQSAAAPGDALEQMRERLNAARAGGGGTKYQVLRDDLQVPAAVAAAASAAVAGSSATAGSPAAPAATAPTAVAGGSLALPVPPEKELAELQGRLWSMCYRDEHVAVYYVPGRKNARKQLLRIDLRCERIGQSADDASVSGVMLRFPAGVSAQEADAAGLVALVAGELRERSAKVRVNIGLAPFLAPRACPLACELRYGIARGGGGPDEAAQSFELRLPPATFLVPSEMSEDAIATYVSENSAELLNHQAAQEVALAAPGRDAAELAGELPALVGRCAGLCHLHGIQQATGSAQTRAQKFLLIAGAPPGRGAAPALPGQRPLPEEARVVCMCAGKARDGALDVSVKVKSCCKEVCDDVCGQLAAVLRELVEGRLAAAR